MTDPMTPPHDDAVAAIKWCEGQALSIMAITAARGDEDANRLASDIAINLAMLAQGIETRSAEIAQQAPSEG